MPFDLDPCACDPQPWPTAARMANGTWSVGIVSATKVWAIDATAQTHEHGTRLGVTSHFQDAKTALHAIGRTVLLGGR